MLCASVEPMPAAAPSSPARPGRAGLYGGLVSSRPRPAAADDDAAVTKQKKRLEFRRVLDDALELVRARKGRLALGPRR